MQKLKVKKTLEVDHAVVVEGSPNKIFQVFSKEGAKRSLQILKKAKVDDFVLFYVQGLNQSEVLALTAAILQKFPDCDIYAEDKVCFVNRNFPRMDGKPDKGQWKALLRLAK